MERYLSCEVCGTNLTPEEERAYWRAYDRLQAQDYAAELLSVTCRQCRAKDRAVQTRMHAVLRAHFAERER